MSSHKCWLFFQSVTEGEAPFVAHAHSEKYCETPPAEVLVVPCERCYASNSQLRLSYDLNVVPLSKHGVVVRRGDAATVVMNPLVAAIAAAAMGHIVEQKIPASQGNIANTVEEPPVELDTTIATESSGLAAVDTIADSVDAVADFINSIDLPADSEPESVVVIV